MRGEDSADIVSLKRGRGIIRFVITAEAFEAMARTLPLGSVGYEAEANERGERLIWL